MHISPNDNRSYRYLTLNNELRVLLIQDEQAQKSAAALAVNVGHFDDPSDREGLAHYLEHMLFLGTEKYPKVGEFQSFISNMVAAITLGQVPSTPAISLISTRMHLKKARSFQSVFHCAPI
ncbi:protease III precursor [Vibrio variabilis]|uniref:Protease III n=1 Tax=Vibrio variabilis TaxID=990271 RepID=A0ABQ0JHN3_9VIBR|nr:protease III precursor [Vibrio variabilis]